jgi:hypothetical protein
MWKVSRLIYVSGDEHHVSLELAEGRSATEFEVVGGKHDGHFLTWLGLLDTARVIDTIQCSCGAATQASFRLGVRSDFDTAQMIKALVGLRLNVPHPARSYYPPAGIEYGIARGEAGGVGDAHS